MDFADILEEWERKTSMPYRHEKHRDDKKIRAVIDSKKNTAETGGAAQRLQASQRSPQDSQRRVNPMDFWMRRYGVFDKDAEYERSEQRRKLLSAAQIKKLPSDAELDLHGLTREEAWVRLESFINECCKRGLKKALIVHGKGNHSEEGPVLKAMVRSFIEQDKRLGASGHPCGADGGSGATWVIIRSNLL
ncbi:Smr/MutS family protein [Treponema sp. OMZ 840]|uniref:Smr/MutS family protein n=1 Tax=Treponema sp. OMZ 840 TaxID=244313 RepID=UPI003D9425E3